MALHLKSLPNWAAQKFVLIDIKTLGEGGVEVKSSWDMWNTRPNGAALIQSKTKSTNQLRSTSKAAADGKSLWGGPGVRQEKNPKPPPPFFFPFFGNHFWSLKLHEHASTETREKGRKEERKEGFSEVRSLPLHVFFIYYFISNERDRTSTFYRSANMKPSSFLPKAGGTEREERNGMAY